MIHFLTTHEHTYTVGVFLDAQPEEFRRRVRIVTYPELARFQHLPRGVYFFTDFDRLGAAHKVAIEHVWNRLHADGGSDLHNHPARSMLRLEFLQTLHDRGLNPINCRVVGDPSRPMRFPTFLRAEGEHAGPRSLILRDDETRRRAAIQMVLDGHGADTLLEVEFLDTALPTGDYRKFGAFLVGGKVLPRHVIFDKDWVVKSPCLTEPWMVREQLDYLTQNPHEEAIRSLFELARIDYGRIDYSLHEGKIVTWEINTNPDIMRPFSLRLPAYEPAYQLFWSALRERLIQMDEPPRRGVVPIEWPADMPQRMLRAEEDAEQNAVNYL